MKIFTVIFLLFLSLTLNAQKNIVGKYRDHFGNSLQLNADNTFEYTWSFDMSGSWTKGTWTLTDDTVYFQMVPIYDTLSQTNVNDIISDTLILSTDRIPERFTQKEFAAMLLSSGGQNRMAYPDKLLFRKGRLYKMQDGKLVLKKRRGFWSGKKGKKWVPWYFKTEE
jgi:hypothetical protein